MGGTSPLRFVGERHIKLRCSSLKKISTLMLDVVERLLDNSHQ